MRRRSWVWVFVACGGLSACKFPELPPISEDAAVDGSVDGAGDTATLTIMRTGAITGTVTSNPAGIACGPTCSFSFPRNTPIDLSAISEAGATFASWSGACSGASSTCSFLLVNDAIVSAAFSPAMHTVTVAVGGNGGGTVTSTPPGLTCPGSCSLSVLHGTNVALSQAPTAGSTFVGWSGGGCTGVAPCSFSVENDVTVNASFALDNSLIVTRIGNGNGRVTSNPAGIDCPGDCDQAYTAGQMVTLTAAASADSIFTGWSGGGCSGTGTCTVTLAAATMVSAEFTLRRYSLTVGTAGAGAGTVSSNPGGIGCPGDCDELYDHGDVVMLTAAPDSASAFGSWSGACSGTGPCSVTMDGPKNVVATFLDTRVLTVSSGGGGRGTITSSPAGINCGSACSARFVLGSMVTLTASPDLNHTFAGWSGGGCSGTGVCTVTLSNAVTVTAAFLAPNIAFVTSTTQTGALGGLAGADAICAARATAAGLPGSYRAWLSTATVTAASRLGTASGWVRTDGLPVASTASALLAGRILYPLVLTESGATAATQDPTIWTGTLADGTASGATCMNWTVQTQAVFGGTGHGLSGTSEWTFVTGTQCLASLPLYCFAIDRVAPVVPATPSIFRRAFVTTATWAPGAGIASADTLCTSEAQAGSLPGAYRAVLPPSATTSAMSRFSISGASWFRVDNVRLGLNPSDFFTFQVRESTLNVTATGAYVTGPVWVGGLLSNSSTSVNDTCSHWAATGGSGLVVPAERGFFGSSVTAQACNQPARVYCLQQ